MPLHASARSPQSIDAVVADRVRRSWVGRLVLCTASSDPLAVDVEAPAPRAAARHLSAFLWLLRHESSSSSAPKSTRSQNERAASRLVTRPNRTRLQTVKFLKGHVLPAARPRLTRRLLGMGATGDGGSTSPVRHSSIDPRARASIEGCWPAVRSAIARGTTGVCGTPSRQQGFLRAHARLGRSVPGDRAGNAQVRA